MNKKHLPFIIVILILIVTIGSIIYKQEAILKNGDTFVLATRPVDPRDLFRGEYVILRYEIERDETVMPLIKNEINGTVVYVKLAEGEDGIARVSEYLKLRPDFSEGGWIRGVITDNAIRFSNLEQFYVPEGTGKAIESLRSDLHVEIVLNEGESRVVKLLDNALDPIDPTIYSNQ
jgi:uncharacterized membrane-anchored protein